MTAQTAPSKNLGRLEQVTLRSIWADEARDFTPWLALPENLRLLGETLGIELETESKEVSVGPYSADIVCRNTADGTKVLIENQIEKTDHCHLGQILTYTAGVGATTMVWIASRFTEEHRAALDWLNEHTTEETSFFGLEVELWRIGQSPAAPKFNIVSKPNDWSKAVRQQSSSVSGSIQRTEEKNLQFKFWTEFKLWLEENTELRVQSPGYQSWLAAPIGRSGFHLALIASLWNNRLNSYAIPELRVELVLNSVNSQQQFDVLKGRRVEIETSLGTALVFHDETSRKRRIYIRRDFELRDQTKWPEAFEWLAKYLKTFTETFRPIVTVL